jgi:hypothetical protein
LLPPKLVVCSSASAARIAAPDDAEAIAYTAIIEEHMNAVRASGAKILTAIAA